MIRPDRCPLRTVYDAGPNYLVMELVDGKTLREWMKDALPVERSLGIARQVLEALGTAHRAGVVHRDLKPENVMVRADGYVKVLDQRSQDREVIEGHRAIDLALTSWATS